LRGHHEGRGKPDYEIRLELKKPPPTLWKRKTSPKNLESGQCSGGHKERQESATLSPKGRSGREHTVLANSTSGVNGVTEEGRGALVIDGGQEGGLVVEERALVEARAIGGVGGKVDVASDDAAGAGHAEAGSIEIRGEEKEGEGLVVERCDIGGDGINGSAAFKGTVVVVPEGGQEFREGRRISIVASGGGGCEGTEVAGIVLGTNGLPEGEKGPGNVVQCQDVLVGGRDVEVGLATGPEGGELGSDGALGAGIGCRGGAEGCEGGGDSVG